MCTVQLRDISGAGTRIRRDFNTRSYTSMGDSDNEKSDQGETGISQQEQDLEKKIKKEIDKLKFYLEEGDELLEDRDYCEIALTCKRTDEIQDRLNDLMSTLQELKIDRSISTQREVRQWKKDLKATYAPLLEMKTKLSKVLEERERSKKLKGRGGETQSEIRAGGEI